MKPNEEFKNWYATEGARTIIDQSEGKHWHEEYQKVAFHAGWTAGMAHACEIVDKVGAELGKTN